MFKFLNNSCFKRLSFVLIHRQSRVTLQTQVLKEQYVPKYFQNSGKLLNILAKSDIWPFSAF